MKKLFKQTSSTLIWLLVTLVALELLLQIGAWVVKENTWRAKTRWLTGDVRVLALGDSNTYGLYLPAQDSYPSQLEKQWNAQHSNLPIEIINLGYPGTNSFRLLANLPEILDTFKPDLVLLMIGFNDVWTPTETLPSAQELSWIEKIQYRSRIYKLAYMLFQNFYFEKTVADQEIDMGARMLGGLSGITFSEAEKKFLKQETGISIDDTAAAQTLIEKNPALKIKFEHALQKIQEQRKKSPPEQDILNTVKVGDKTFSLGIKTGESAHNSKQMEQNISSMLIQLNERNIRYILINYPSNHGYYPAANRKIEKIATQTHSPFIDLSSTFNHECRKRPKSCPEYFFYDGHATAKGNELISATVASGLADFFQARQP
jgi:lysophospholipase L1-like esterase